MKPLPDRRDADSLRKVLLKQDDASQKVMGSNHCPGKDFSIATKIVLENLDKIKFIPFPGDEHCLIFRSHID